MKSLMLVVLSMVSTSAFAEQACYQLSPNGVAFSRTPEVLCVDLDADAISAEITLETGMFERDVIATFNMDLLQRARCPDCNQDVFGVSNPSNSIFNALQITFDGQGQEGTVKIGENLFYYRSL